MHGALAGLLGQGGQQQALALRQQLFLLRQHIHGEHQRQQHIHQRAQNGRGDVDSGVDHAVAVAGEELGDELGGVLHVHGKLRQGDAVVGGKGREAIPPALYLGDIRRYIGHQRGARLLQTGNKNEDNGKDDAQKQQECEGQADGALQLHPPQLRRLFQRLVPKPLNGHEQQIHHIGDAHADEQRGKQGQDAAQQPAQNGQVVQPPVQEDGAGYEQQNALDIFLIQLQRNPAFLKCAAAQQHGLRRSFPYIVPCSIGKSHVFFREKRRRPTFQPQKEPARPTKNLFYAGKAKDMFREIFTSP